MCSNLDRTNLVFIQTQLCLETSYLNRKSLIRKSNSLKSLSKLSLTPINMVAMATCYLQGCLVSGPSGSLAPPLREGKVTVPYYEAHNKCCVDRPLSKRPKILSKISTLSLVISKKMRVQMANKPFVFILRVIDFSHGN